MVMNGLKKLLLGFLLISGLGWTTSGNPLNSYKGPINLTGNPTGQIKNVMMQTYQPASYLSNSTSSSLGAGVTSISLAKPTGAVNGLAEVLMCNSPNQPSIDSSWTVWRHDTGSFRDLWTLKHIVNSDPSSYTITWSPNVGGGGGYFCTVVVFANSSGFDSINGQWCNSGSCTVTAPTASYTNELIFIKTDDGANFVSPVVTAPPQAFKVASDLGGGLFGNIWQYIGSPANATVAANFTSQQIIQEMVILGSPIQDFPVIQGQQGATLTSLQATNPAAPNTITGFSIANVFNVRDPFFGADGNDLNDDAPAIQAAYNYACANSPSAIFIPAGKYLINEPLQFNCLTGSVEVYGAGEIISTLDMGNRSGPGVIVSPTANLIAANGSLTSASLLTGNGVSLNFPNPASSTGFTWNIKEMLVTGSSQNPANPLNGLANFTFEGEANLSNSATNGTEYCIMQSHAYVSASGQSTTAARMCAVANGNLRGSINVGGTSVSVAGGTFTKGTNHAVALVLDSAGTNDGGCTAGTPCVRLYLDGTEVNNHTASGTIQQGADEDWGLGMGDPFDGQWPESWPPASTDGWFGQIDGVRISKVARYQATSYTPSSSKPGSDSNTIFLLNNDLPANGANIGTTGVIEADSTLPSTAPEWGYVRTTAWPVASQPQKIHDFSIFGQFGEPLYVDALPRFQAMNMQLTGGYKGLNCRNNTFESRFANLTITVGSYSESGLSMSCGQIINLDNIQVYNGIYDVVLSQGTFDIKNLFLNPVSTTLYDMYESSSSIFTPITHMNVNVDSELGGPTVGGIWIDDNQPGQHTFVGGNIQSLGAANVPPIVLTNNNSASVLLDHVSVSTVGGSTGPIVHWLGAPAANEQVTFIDPRINGTGVNGVSQPLSDQPSGTHVDPSALCSASSAMVAGAKTVSANCITTSSICRCVDTTTATNACNRSANPTTGNQAFTGTGTDNFTWICDN